jgi:ectoine hydroxylase-related dioxygenase (phytanoyl-CoA dioxygenase family)
MIFRDKYLNEQLETKGYVIIPFAAPAQLEKLREIYQRYKANSPYFHSTTFSDDLELKKKLSSEVGEVYTENLNSFFEHYRKMGASFLCKPFGEGGHMPVHQDWTIVDETRYASYTIWVPLQDVDETNGAITVLDGSHLFTPTLRGPTLPVVIRDLEPAVKDQLKTLRMKAGEAFIFNHALIHASHLNRTKNDRIAVTFGLIPEKAQLMFYHLNEQQEIEKYLVEDDFFMRYANIGKRPDFVEPVEIVKEEFEQVTEKRWNEFLQNYKMKQMKPIFKDARLQEQFERDGYLLVDLLNDSEVKELKEYYNTLNNDHIPFYGFHVSLDNSNADFVSGVMNKIKSVITRHADEIFKDYKIFTSSYVVKEKNPIGVVPPHQDWSFTEEDEGYTSATVWTALVDTDMLNGAMGVIVGSHRFFDHHRASPAPQFKTPLDTHVFSIFPYLKLLPMKAGQALIFDNRTVHASPPNISEGTRLAVGFGVTQADAPLRHFYMQPGSDGKKLEKYEVDDYFYTHYNNGKLSALYNEGKRPEGLKFLGLTDNRVKDISADELVAKMKAAGNTFNIEMCEHLAKLFSYNLDGSKKQEPVTVEPDPVIEKPVESAQPTVVEQEEEPVVQQVRLEVAEPVEQSQQVSEPIPNTWIDQRTFFQKYTPLNIIREIKSKVLS